MKHKILIMAVLLLAILIGGIGGFAINSFLYDKSTIVKTERKEKMSNLKEMRKMKKMMNLVAKVLFQELIIL